MAMAIWPGPDSLPQVFAAQTFGDVFSDNVITDNYNVGPPDYRRRTTAGPENFGGQIFMTTAEWENLSAFFHGTLFDGVMRFLLPPQGVTDLGRYWICRFISPPLRQMTNATNLWTVSLSLERLGYGQFFAIPPHLVDVDVLYPPTILYDQIIAPSLISIPDTFYAPDVEGGVEGVEGGDAWGESAWGEPA